MTGFITLYIILFPPGSGWIQPEVQVAAGGVAPSKGDGDSGCGTDSEEDMEAEERIHDGTVYHAHA